MMIPKLQPRNLSHARSDRDDCTKSFTRVPTSFTRFGWYTGILLTCLIKPLFTGRGCRGWELNCVGWDLKIWYALSSVFRSWTSLIWIQKPISSIATQESKQVKLGLSQLLRMGTTSVPNLFLNSLRILLPTAIFFIKFLEWWYSPSSPARILVRPKAGPAIPPPKMLQPHPQGLSMEDLHYGQCPICRNYIANATALPSGYVFCYRCVHAHVEKHSICPVTLMPVQIRELRKILI